MQPFGYFVRLYKYNHKSKTMKKFLLFAFIAITFTSCRVTKTFTIINARGTSNNTEMQFLKSKGERVAFLDLSDEQKEKAIVIWQTEKRELGDAYTKKNKEIAPIIYKSETELRSLFTEEQLTKYREKYNGLLTSSGLNDKQLEELKRIYKL